MKNKPATFVLVVILSSAAPAFADHIPARSSAEDKDVTLAKSFSGTQNFQDISVRRDSRIDTVKGNRSRISPTAGASLSDSAKGEKGSALGTFSSTGMGSENAGINVVNFDVNQGASFEKEKIKLRGKHNGGDGNDGGNSGVNGGSNGGGNDGSASGPVLSISEPGSRTLLLFGLAGLGMIFYRRNTLRNAI